MAQKYSSDWSQVAGNPDVGYFVQARGASFNANIGSEHKISHYVSDGAGGFRLAWRTGRTALTLPGQQGELYAAMRIQQPINGLVSVIDQTRSGLVLYTREGLYVDSVLADGSRNQKSRTGLYSQPGEFFCGTVFPNRENGRLYLGMGKQTPLLFELEGWSIQDNPVRPLAAVPQSVTLTAAQTSDPPDVALSLRGGVGKARVARFSPALGMGKLDATLTGWESCDPVVFEADKDHTVEVRCLYHPDELLLRWHARLGSKFNSRSLPPIPRIFTHEQQADTLSFYLQGDPAAPAAGASGGRPGDVRFVFGLFLKGRNLQPVCVGMYPHWSGPGRGKPQVYRTPVGKAEFANVGLVDGVRSAHAVDPDGKGFVLVAGIPRAAVPQLSAAFDGQFRTRVNFDANFGGHNRFWWSNADGSANRETYDEPSEAGLYPGAWSPAQFQGIDEGVIVRNWLICGPFGGPGAERFRSDPPGPMKREVQAFFEASNFPPDSGKVDAKAIFKGLQIRGYWPEQNEVRWKPASLQPLETRVILGGGGQAWYGATWLHAPEDLKIECQLHEHPASTFRWFLNAQRLATAELRPDAASKKDNCILPLTLSLQRGWNEIRFRGYCVGYPPFRAGLVLTGPPQKLWTLQLSATAPEK